MAATTTFTARLSVAESGDTRTLNGSDSATQAGAQTIFTDQLVGTTTETIGLGDVSTPGYAFFKNMSADNYVMIGLATPVSSSNAFITLLPGEFAFVPTRQTTIYAIADTAECNIRYLIAEL